MGQVTKQIIDYPLGHEPNYIMPNKYCSYRFALGKTGKNPLVAICMNPSRAEEKCSDRTINRIINISMQLCVDGWMVFNLYPERATDAKTLSAYDENLSSQNIKCICDYLVNNGITEVWGAWGDDKGLEPLTIAKQNLLKILSDRGIKIYYFGTLTKSGNPRHPLQRFEKWSFGDKHYLEDA